MESVSTSTTPAQWVSLISEVAQAIDLTNLILESEMEAKVAGGSAPTISTATQLSHDALAKTVDHTLLKGESDEAIDQVCEEAKKDGFPCVVVRPPRVGRCWENLKGTEVAVACGVGFPDGKKEKEEKAEEATTGASTGATEFEIVSPHHIMSTHLANTPSADPPYSDLYAHYSHIYTTIRSEVSKFHSGHSSAAETAGTSAGYAILKTILETSQLTPHLVQGCSVVALAAGTDLVKTSTGFCGRGASVLDVKIMVAVTKYWNGKFASGYGKEGVRSERGVKPSGEIRDLAKAELMVGLGAERLGTASAVKIMTEWREREEGK